MITLDPQNNSTTVFVDGEYFGEINQWGSLIVDGTDCEIHELTPHEVSIILEKMLEVKKAIEDGTTTAE